MSVRISSRVWECSNLPGAKKLLLLALADHANDDGIAWPGAVKLAAKINQSERHTRRLLQELESSGHIACKQGGGRGHQTLYGVLVGMTDQQSQKARSILKNTVIQNSVPGVTVSKETVTSPRINSDIQGKETVTFSSAPKVPFEALQSDEMAVIHNNNHKRTVIEPEEEAREIISHTATTAAKLCNLPDRMSKPQAANLGALVAFLQANDVPDEKLAAFAAWWQTKSYPARQAAKERRQVSPPSPSQVVRFWPEFDTPAPADVYAAYQPPVRAAPDTNEPPAGPGIAAEYRRRQAARQAALAT